MDRRAFLIGAPLVLAGCSGGISVRAPDDAVNAAIYRSGGPATLTLYTVRNSGSDNGAQSALLIDASQRVLFDPAGSFANPSIPERDDVLFGFSPRVEVFYISYHARQSYYVEGLTIAVPADVAEQALRLSLANGPMAQMWCTRAVSSVIGQLRGFGTIKPTFFPDTLSDNFRAIAGVTETIYREDDTDDKSVAAAQINAALKERP